VTYSDRQKISVWGYLHFHSMKSVRNPETKVQNHQRPEIFVVEFHGFSTVFGTKMVLFE